MVQKLGPHHFLDRGDQKYKLISRVVRASSRATIFGIDTRMGALQFPATLPGKLVGRRLRGRSFGLPSLARQRGLELSQAVFVEARINGRHVPGDSGAVGTNHAAVVGRHAVQRGEVLVESRNQTSQCPPLLRDRVL